jgi:hypothetical protein
VAEGSVPAIGELPADQPAFLEQLERVGITRSEHVAVRLIGGKRELMQYLAPLGPPVNSDFRPFVQLESARARFANRSATATLQLSLSALPLNEMLSRREPVYLPEPPPTRGAKRLALQGEALEFERALLDPAIDPLRDRGRGSACAAAHSQAPARVLCGAEPAAVRASISSTAAAELTLARLAPERRQRIWVEPRWAGCAPEAMSAEVRQRMEVYRAIALRDAAGMHKLAATMLDTQAVKGFRVGEVSPHDRDAGRTRLRTRRRRHATVALARQGALSGRAGSRPRSST